MTTLSRGGKITRLHAELAGKVYLQASKGRALIESVNVIRYGYLYNHYAVNKHIEESDDDYNLAPEGWRVASNADWTALHTRIDTEHNVAPNSFGVGNHLKHRRQIGTPLGGIYNTSEHPRWASHATHYGRDTVGFGAIPGGLRQSWGFGALGGGFFTWTQEGNGIYIQVSLNIVVTDPSYDMFSGFSVRCCRDATVEEQALADGDACDQAEDIDGNTYRTVKIGDRVWMHENLAVSRYRGGATIPKIEGTAAWVADTNGARCAYDNNDAWVFYYKEWL